MTTTEIVKNCFKKAGMESVKDDRSKYLFKLLCDELDKHFFKIKNNHFENEVANILAEGYSLELGSGKIISSANSNTEFEDKEFVVEKHFGKEKGYKTLKGAMNYLESEEQF